MDGQPEFLGQFSAAWRGGYFENDPRERMGANTLGVHGYNSYAYTVYLACIRPYLPKGGTVLEIGPGRGAWTKAILDRDCGTVYAVDAAPAEHTGFWDYVGRDSRVRYLVASDFELADVPDGVIDFVFSMGCFCHLKPEMSEAYLRSIARKMKPGANGFISFADFDQYMHVVSHPERYSILRFFFEQRRKVWQPARLALAMTWRFFRPKMDVEHISKDRPQNLTDAVGRTSWYHWAVRDAAAAAARCRLTVVDADMGATVRDPIIHFTR